MAINGIFIFFKLLNKTNHTNVLIKRYYATRLVNKHFEKLLSRLHKSLDQSSADVGNYQNVVAIANEFLDNRYTLRENSLFLSKICKYDKLSPEFWSKYLNKLNERITEERSKRVDSEKLVNELDAFSEFSRVLKSANLTSTPFALYFTKAAMSNIYNIIPYKMGVLRSLLDYLVYTESKEKLSETVFELLIDFVWEIKPNDIIHIMYCIGKLGHKNEELIQAFSRVLTNCLSKGILTPHEKTKLAKAYSVSNYEHITFFSHITKELIFMFSNMDFGNYFKNEPKTKNHMEGVRSSDRRPAGVMVDGLKYIQYYSNESDNAIKEPERVEFKGEDEQLYSCGQMMYILDGMIYLRIHHLEPEFKKLVTYAMKHLFKPEVVEHFDVEQLRCAVSFLATLRKSVDDSLIEMITKRFVQEYLHGNASNAQLSLFLKNLVKLTKIVVKRRNIRNKILHTSTFVPPKWINNQLYDNPDLMDPNSTRSILEQLCYKICDNVNGFNMADLTSCLRSVAYLGFKNDKFYNVFIPFFKQNLQSLNHVSVSNLTQSFNKAGVKDKYFFYLLGKHHQLYLHDVEDKVYIKRIG